MSKNNKKRLDLSTLFGVLAAFTLIITAMIMGGNVIGFLDYPSICIVLGGTFAVTIACFSLREVMHAHAVILHTVFYVYEDISSSVFKAIELAEIARQKGLLQLDKIIDSSEYKNRFLQEGIEQVIDNTNPDDIETILNFKLESMVQRHAKSVAILRKAAEISPAMGLIGTLIGLVQMLGNLQDTSTIGPAMAVALITTFYGAVMSYMVFSPLASKLERNTKDEILIAEIYMHTIISIARRESPRKLEMVLNSILPPIKRINYMDMKHGVLDEKAEAGKA